jgi:signal transduction histidine kinase
MTGPTGIARPLLDGRWPWITRRRALAAALLLTGAAIAIPWHHRLSQRRFLAEIDQVLPLGVSMSADAIADWVAVRTAHARTVARVASQFAPVPALAARMQPVLDVVVVEGAFRDGHIELARVDEPSTALRTVPVGGSDGVSTVEFRAPVMRAGRAVGAVVLRSELTERALSHFNLAAADDRTQRTVLLLRSAPGDEAPFPILAISAPGGGHAPASRSLPSGVSARRAAGASFGTPAGLASASHGIGIGVTGVPVVYAAVPIRGTPWLLVREREVAEFLARLAPSLLITDAIFSLLTALVLGVMLLRWRADHQRRETAAVALRSTFVASISHELRTPLTQVRMYAEMLRLGLLSSDEERGTALQVIEKEAGRLTLLMDRALSFVRAGRTVSVPQVESVVVADAVARALDAIAPLAGERHVRLRHDVEGALTVAIARDDLHQVLLNLLDNAIKYGPDGQVVQIGARHAAGTGTAARVRITIRDHGRGVLKTEREAIWQPFRRGHAASASSASGTGIGLVVVRDLVERAGGRAFVDEAPPSPDGGPARGAVFVVELPSAG